MKVIKHLLLLIVLFSPLYSFNKNHIKADKKEIARNGSRGHGGRRGNSRSGVRFRFYVGPRYPRRYYYRGYGYYYNQVSINIKEDSSSGERVLDAFIDGYRINLKTPTSSGNRGYYSFRLTPGYHVIEWSVESSRGKVDRYDYRFYVDRYNRYTNILIEGDQIFIN